MYEMEHTILSLNLNYLRKVGWQMSFSSMICFKEFLGYNYNRDYSSQALWLSAVFKPTKQKDPSQSTSIEFP